MLVSHFQDPARRPKHKQFTQQPALKQSESLEACKKILCISLQRFASLKLSQNKKPKKKIITSGEIYIYFVQKRKTTWFCTSYYSHVNSTLNITAWDVVTTTGCHRQLGKRHVLEVWTAFQTTCASLLSYPRALDAKGGFCWRKEVEAGGVKWTSIQEECPSASCGGPCDSYTWKLVTPLDNIRLTSAGVESRIVHSGLGPVKQRNGKQPKSIFFRKKKFYCCN